MVSVVLACIRRITVTKGDNLKNAIATGGQVGTCNFISTVCVQIFSFHGQSKSRIFVVLLSKIICYQPLSSICI